MTKLPITIPTPSLRQRLAGLWLVVRIIWQEAPLTIAVQAVGAVLSAVLPLATAYYAALTTTALAEAYATGGQPQQLLTYVVVTVVLGVVASVWSVVQGYYDQVSRYRIEAAMSDHMYARLHALDFWRYDDPTTIDMFDKAQRFVQSFSYLFIQLVQMLTALVSLATSLWMIVMVSWWLGLLVLVALVPSSVVQVRLSRLQAGHWREQVATRRRMAWIEHILSRPNFIAELRLYGVIHHLLGERAALRDKDRLRVLGYERRFMGQRLGGEIIQAAAEVVALAWVVLEIVAHRQPIGQFVLVQQMVGRVMSGMDNVINTYNMIDEDLATMADYQQFMALPVASQAATIDEVTLRDAIAVQQVSFCYPGTQTAVLRDISLTIRRGQHIAIVGENGAGKSTLVKLLTGLYQPSKGSITIDGHDLRHINPAAWHRQLAVLGQEFIRYDFATAHENVWYGDVSQPVDAARRDAALRQAEAADFVRKLPHGGDSYISKWMEANDHETGVDLSGGQWQRLALARNLYRNAPIIILDEPTSAIDAAAEARIFRRLFAKQGKTIITISHRYSTVKKADAIYVIAHGRIVEHGTAAALMAQRGAFYEMFKEQI